MKKTLFPPLIVFFVSARSFAADAPPKNMHEHLEWCATATTPAEAITRYEGFWRAYCPAEDGGLPAASNGYGDGSHVLHVRSCAYHLLKLYIETKKTEKATYYADWLRATDPVIDSRPTKIPQQNAK